MGGGWRFAGLGVRVRVGMGQQQRIVKLGQQLEVGHAAREHGVRRDQSPLTGRERKIKGLDINSSALYMYSVLSLPLLNAGSISCSLWQNIITIHKTGPSVSPSSLLHNPMPEPSRTLVTLHLVEDPTGCLVHTSDHESFARRAFCPAHQLGLKRDRGAGCSPRPLLGDARLGVELIWLG